MITLAFAFGFFACACSVPNYNLQGGASGGSGGERGDAGSSGCEETSNDVKNCGACGHACSANHATPACADAGCELACDVGWDDCNDNVSDGCETNLQGSTSHCGACALVCKNAHGDTSCVGGKCLPSCGSGFANCSGRAEVGCETSVFTDTNNCGSCGNVCHLAHATASCNSGRCAIATCEAGWADCNGVADDGCETDLRSSAAHCAACGTACSSINGTASCAAGKCGIACNKGYADCDGNASNGCEANLDNGVNNCGACGTVCSPQANRTAVCNGGVCGVSDCVSPYGNCSGNGCVTNLMTDVNNCGGCGNKCVFANAAAKCSGGLCGIATCNVGFADCNGSSSDGCEVNLNTDLNNCGACGGKCSPASATGVCTSGICTISACTGNFRDCDGSVSNGCETDVTQNVSNCGACGNACSTNHATSSCSGGACSIACAVGYANCDGNLTNGCEAILAADVNNCGACENSCVVNNDTPACVDATCTIAACNAGYGDCDRVAANGCEAALDTTNNCGACGSTCTNPNGTTACASGACAPTCTAGFLDCDNNPANGCERDVSSDPKHCGTCDTVCSYANAAANCVRGSCSLGACIAGYGNCDSTESNGCEAPLDSTINCGACGNACATLHATPACSNGGCSIACAAGFANCSGNPTAGCATDILTDSKNCGSCGHACTYGCTAGSCDKPCTGICAAPIDFTLDGTGKCTFGSNPQSACTSPALGTTGACYQTTSSLSGFGCSNASGRTLAVNASSRTCDGQWSPLPTPVNGGYCFSMSAGGVSNAVIYVW